MDNSRVLDLLLYASLAIGAVAYAWLLLKSLTFMFKSIMKRMMD